MRPVAIIGEVRRQFREIPGLMEGTAKTGLGHLRVDIVTSAALKEMVVPGLLAVIIPLVVGLISPVPSADCWPGRWSRDSCWPS